MNRLLEAQQLQEGREDDTLQRASIADAARTAITRLRPQAEAKGVRLELRARDQARTPASIAAPSPTPSKTSSRTPSRTRRTDPVSRSPRRRRATRSGWKCRIGASGSTPRTFREFLRVLPGRRGESADVRCTGWGLLVKGIVEGHGGTIAKCNRDSGVYSPRCCRGGRTSTQRLPDARHRASGLCDELVIVCVVDGVTFEGFAGGAPLRWCCWAWKVCDGVRWSSSASL